MASVCQWRTAKPVRWATPARRGCRNVGAFAANTTVTSITNTTSFVISAAPSTALSGGATVIKGTGSDHQIFTISVVSGTPQTFSAFAGSPVTVSGTGTTV
mgnify:CR=1 FL=1